MTNICLKLCLWRMLALPLAASAGEFDWPTQFLNTGGIINTRHNMTQSTLTPAGFMATTKAYRNRYGSVCIYCHTPHGANASAAAPLWNRLSPVGPYTTYDKLGTSSLTQTVYNPGAASLPCLSCHDGSQATDRIINMPGAGQYSPTATQIWAPWVVNDQYSKTTVHARLSTEAPSCLSCHSPDGIATDFTVAVIGKDLTNDHPIGVIYPTINGGDTGWNTPGGSKVVAGLTNKFFDENGNGRMDKGDIRLYDTGNGASVECASCHDPHGVPSGAAGSSFLPTFLRKPIEGSGVCMTCHAK